MTAQPTSRSTARSPAVSTGAGALVAASLVELAVQRLRGEIVSGKFPPGGRLVEEQLTRRFGISRAPVREALRLLGQQGLVEHLPRRGVRVVQLSSRDIDEGARRHRRLYEAVVGGHVPTVLDELARHGSRTYLAPELDGEA